MLRIGSLLSLGLASYLSLDFFVTVCCCCGHEKVLRMYPALKDSKNDLEFGYKIEYEALTEKQEVTVRVHEYRNKRLFFSWPCVRMVQVVSANRLT